MPVGQPFWKLCIPNALASAHNQLGNNLAHQKLAEAKA